MKTFFDKDASHEFKNRLASLKPDSERQWGKMNSAQMVAHLCKGMEQAMGEVRPPRIFLGRIIGGFVKSRAIGNDEPMFRNSPTIPSFIIADDRDLEAERQRLYGLIDRASAAGPSVCTEHPHSFFGRLTPEQWGNLIYKHLDHHLRQFGV
ncbi:MAG: DUF1569 domain-containing protein [Nitrosospira sp.]